MRKATTSAYMKDETWKCIFKHYPLLRLREIRHTHRAGGIISLLVHKQYSRNSKKANLFNFEKSYTLQVPTVPGKAPTFQCNPYLFHSRNSSAFRENWTENRSPLTECYCRTPPLKLIIIQTISISLSLIDPEQCSPATFSYKCCMNSNLIPNCS